jgi:hypothetical protein
MKPKVTSEVYRYVLPRTQQAVLLAFADHVNGERAEHGDTVVWPSIGRIAWMTGLDRRTVALATQGLVKRGALVEVSKARHHEPAAYRIVLSALPLKAAPVKQEVGGIDRISVRGGAPPLLRGGAPPPLIPDSEAVRTREEAVPTSSRGGAPPPKPKGNLNEPVSQTSQDTKSVDVEVASAMTVIANIAGTGKTRQRKRRETGTRSESVRERTTR